MNKKARQYLGIIISVIIYYIIHEGAHLLMALYYETFKTIHFMGIGIQIDVYREQMTDIQLGIFCLMGPIATFLAAWVLVGFCKKICQLKSKVIRAIGWYVSLIMLLLDPIYLSVLYRFVGGGDMNGIKLLAPEGIAAAIFLVIAVIHMVVVCKYIYPQYKQAFSQ